MSVSDLEISTEQNEEYQRREANLAELRILKGFFVLLAHFRDKGLGRLECRDVVGRNHDRRILGDVAGGLLRTGLHREAAEAAEINILTFRQ